MSPCRVGVNNAVNEPIFVALALAGRGLHSSTSQLNLRRFRHKNTVEHPLKPHNTPQHPHNTP